MNVVIGTILRAFNPLITKEVSVILLVTKGMETTNWLSSDISYGWPCKWRLVQWGGGVGKGNSSSCPIYERQDLKDTPIECTNNSVHQIAIGISQLAAATCRGAKCASRRGKKTKFTSVASRDLNHAPQRRSGFFTTLLLWK